MADLPRLALLHDGIKVPTKIRAFTRWLYYQDDSKDDAQVIPQTKTIN